MPNKNAMTNHHRIQTLLQQCQRQFTHPEQHRRQPHAVAESLGRALAHACCETKKNSKDDDDDFPEQTKILETLARTDLHPSIAHAFFENLPVDDTMTTSFLATGMVVLEEATCFLACARAYAKNIVHNTSPSPNQETTIALLLLEIYQRLEQPSSRAVLIREVIPLLREKKTSSRVPTILSPLLNVTFLSPSSFEEQSLVLQQVWRVLWSIWAHETLMYKIHILEWLTQVLKLVLMAQDNQNQIELFQSWFIELVLLAQSAVDHCDDDDDKEIRLLVQWSDALLGDIVPLLRDKANQRRSTGSSFSTLSASWKPIYDGLVDWLVLLKEVSDNNTLCALDPWSVLQWSTLLLSTHSRDERTSLLTLLFHWTTPRWTVSLPFVRSLLEGLSCIWIHDPDCQLLALQLKQELLANTTTETVAEAFTNGSSSIGARLLEGDHSVLGKLLLSSDATKLSSEMQIAMLLVAVSHLSVLSEQRHWYAFLERLIQAYPHLGITFLPVHLQLVQNAAQTCDGSSLLRHLEFMAGPLVIDPHCAQQVWTFLCSQWVLDCGAMDLRIAIIRLYPVICRTNKRMYRRVIDSLGSLMNEKDPEIRLAVAASTCDLAKDDSIREVADVIGWIQQLLTEDEKLPIYALLKHYAIMSLHFLTLHGELEFPLVIKVLNKKLCKLTDHEKVIEFPMPILEAICLLLGDGEGEESDDDTNDVVGLQVRQSIDTLLYLGDALTKMHKKLQANERRISGVETALAHIFESLNRYSLRTLEVDEEDVKLAAAVSDETDENFPKTDSNRYLRLQELLLDGMESLPSQSKDNDTVQPVIGLARRLMSFEEDVLGANFWQKRSSLRTGGRVSRHRLGREQVLRGALPSASLLTSLPGPPLSNGRAIAALLASDGTKLTIFRDNADACIDSTDPLLLAFAVKGFLRIAGLCLRNTSLSPSSLLNEIRGWNEIFVSPDAMHLCLVSIVVSLSEGSPPDEGLRSEIVAVAEETLFSFQDNEFHDESIGKICVGLCGMVYVHLGEYQQAVKMLDSLEHSVRGFGGQQDFGAYFGVAIIAQAVEALSKRAQPTLPRDEMSRLTTKAASFIVEELLSCFKDGGNVATGLLACINAGKSTPDLVQSVERLGSNSLSMHTSKNIVAHYLLISSSICLPSLAISDGSLLLAVFRLIESFQWTVGKGIALASILRQCDTSHIITKAELELIHYEYTSIFQRRIDLADKDVDVKADGLDGIFYAVTGTSTAAMPQSVRRHVVENMVLFDDDACATFLLACVLSICSIPALEMTLTDIPRIRPGWNELDVKDIIGIVLAAAKRDDGSKYSIVGTILLGMLSSAQIETKTSLKCNSTSKRSDKNGNEPTAFGIEIFSRPQLGTLSERVTTLLERSFFVARDKECIGLPSSLAALEILSLPGEFAKGVILKYLQTIKWGGEAVVSLLCSQIHGRRSVLQDGREFVDLALHISASTPDTWRSTIAERSARDMFIKELYRIFPKISVAALEKSIKNLWDLCSHPGTGSRVMAIQFLNGMRRLLGGSLLSSKAKQVICDLLFGECYASMISGSLCEASIDTEGCGSLLTAFISCAQLAPLAALESSSISSLAPRAANSSMIQDSFRAYVVLKLLSVDGCIPSSHKQTVLKQYQCWLVQSLASIDSFHSAEINSLRSLHHTFATLTSVQSVESKHEILLSVMDSMLLASGWTLTASLDLLGMLVATWCRDFGESSTLLTGLLDLDNMEMETLSTRDWIIIYEAVVKVFPKNLSLFVTSENRAQFLNILHRLCLRFEGVAPEMMSGAILCAFFSCQSVLGKDSLSIFEATKFTMKY